MSRDGLGRRGSTYGSGGLGLVDSRVDGSLDVVARSLLDLLLASRDEAVAEEETVRTWSCDKIRRWDSPLDLVEGVGGGVTGSGDVALGGTGIGGSLSVTGSVLGLVGASRDQAAVGPDWSVS